MAHKGAGDHKILIYLLTYSNKLAYLQLIIVLVYGNSSPKSHEQDYLNFQQKLWNASQIIFRRYNFTKNELFLRYFLRILFKSFWGTSSTIELLCFYRTLPWIFVVIVNTLCTVFLQKSRIMLTIKQSLKFFSFLTMRFYRLCSESVEEAKGAAFIQWRNSLQWCSTNW